MSKKYLPDLNNSYKTTLIFLFLIAAVSRFFYIDSDSILLDEAYCIRVTSHNFIDMLKKSLNDSNPPLYNILLFFWSRLWGYSETAIRSLSALLNLFSFPFIFLITKKLFNNKNISLFTLLIFSLSPFHVYFSQMARSYSLFLFLSTASVYFFISLLENFSLRKSTGFIIFSTLMLYTHVYGWFVLFFENCWILFLWINKDKTVFIVKWIKLEIAIFLLFFPYAIKFAFIVFRTQETFWVAKPTILNLGGTILHFSGSPLLFVFFSLLLFFLIFQFLIFFKCKKTFTDFQKQFLLIFLWLSIPIIIPFLLSLIIKPFYLAKYAIPSSIPFYILIAFSFNTIKTSRIRIFIVAIFLFISGISLYQDYTNPTREPWREVTNDLKMHCDKNDLVLVGADYCYYGPVKYYLKDHNLNTFAISNRSFPEDSLQTIVHNYYKNGGKNIWFVSSHFNNYEKTVLKLLEQNYLLKKKNPYSYMDFYGRNKTVITIYNFKVK